MVFISIYAFLMGLFVLIKQKPDIIYKRQSSIGEDILIARLARCPVVTEINGPISDEHGTKKTVIHKFINNILIQISKQSILHNDHLVTVTPNLKNLIQNELSIPEKKITVIPNGANVKIFHPSDKKLSCELLNLHSDFKYICFIGNLAYYQGIEYMIQASPLILSECPDARFLIVGDGTMKNEWMKIAQNVGVYEKFIFTGGVPFEQVPLYINASDVCIAPFKISRNANIGLSPLKIYEYMACGKPVVSSRIPNLEFIEEQNAGLLVEPENPEELAKAVIKLMKDESLREEMGKKGRDFVVRYYSWEANARRVAEVCENLVEEYNRA
jgi:glycosyltransferase involved in cell wall biosynthesis